MEKDRMPGRKPPKAKKDLKSHKEEMIHQMHVISENVIDQVKLVAEGVSNVNEKLERFREEIREDLDDRINPLALAISTVSDRLDQTRQEFNDKLDQTRQELRAEIRDTRQELSENLNKTRQELKTEIQESRQEVLAATKFSYAELDRRLTSLEEKFVDLKVRFEKIESRSTP
jgi:ABC-type transporter Mla subunit MlaD